MREKVPKEVIGMLGTKERSGDDEDDATKGHGNRDGDEVIVKVSPELMESSAAVRSPIYQSSYNPTFK